MMIRFCAVLLLLTASVVTANSQTVSGSIANGSVRRGTTARGFVEMQIPSERHVNSNRPGSEYLIPTVVKLSAKGVRVGRVVYPRGLDKNFQFTTKTLNVYEGTVRFPFRVTIPRNYRGRYITVNATVDFQACTDEVCYAPRKEDLKITARVR
jgi:DsbC/DsbD-like thiol-disulfide interchange protein